MSAIPPPDALSDIAMMVAFWLGVACIVGAGIVMFVKLIVIPKMGGSLGSSSAKKSEWRAKDFSLESLQALRDKGELTQEQFDRASAKVRASAAHEAALAAAAAAQVEPGIFTTTVPPAIRPKTATPAKTPLPSNQPLTDVPKSDPGTTVAGLPPSPDQLPPTDAALPIEPTEKPQVSAPTQDLPKRPDSEPPSGRSPNEKNGELW